MKHKLELYYSIQNGGDGSAYPEFFESAELAEWDQENPLYDEGWAEDCSGTLRLESDSPIVASFLIKTAQEIAEDLRADQADYYCESTAKRLESLERFIEGRSS